MEQQASQTIEIRLNGKPHRIGEGAVVLALVEELGLPADRVAIELDREILKRGLWAETVLRPGSEVEIVHFVGGGLG